MSVQKSRCRKQKQPLFGLEMPQMFLGQGPRLCSLPVLCGSASEWDETELSGSTKILSFLNITYLLCNWQKSQSYDGEQ